MSQRSIDISIFCALAEEAKAVLEVVSHRCIVSWQVVQTDHITYHRTSITNQYGQELRIAVTCLTRMGVVPSALLLPDILNVQKPKLVIMTGICAGDRSQVQLGDLIVAERVYFYDTGKFSQDSEGRQYHEHDTRTYSSSDQYIQFTRMFNGWQTALDSLVRPVSRRQQRDWLLEQYLSERIQHIRELDSVVLQRNAPRWRDILQELQHDNILTSDLALSHREELEKKLLFGKDPFPFRDASQSRCFIKPIASGSAVRADNPFQDIRMPVRGVAGIDMEGAVLGECIATIPAYKHISWLLVKGVCDYADEEKDDSFHEYAALASAHYALSLIQEYQIMPVSAHTSLQQQRPLNVFISYAHEDEADKNHLEAHLSTLKRQNIIQTFHSQQIGAGQGKLATLKASLEEAQLVIILLSAKYFFSSSLVEHEMNAMLERSQAGEVRIIPVVLRPVRLDMTPFHALQTLPRKYPTVWDYPHPDQAWSDIVGEIGKICLE